MKDHIKHRIEHIEAEHAAINKKIDGLEKTCLLYTSPSPRDVEESRMPSSA